MNVSDTKKAIKIARMIGKTLNIVGPHGEGKSSVVKQAAKELGMHYKEFRTGQAADPGDLTGLPEFGEIKLKNGGTSKVTNFILPDWFPREENTLVFLDEVNRGAKDILNGVFEIILDLSMKGYPLPAGCQVVTAMNPPTDDYCGTIDFNDKAFQDRFIHIKFKPLASETLGYFKDKAPMSGFVSFLQDDNKYLRDADLLDFQLDFVKPSPRSWETAIKLEQSYDAGDMGHGKEARGFFLEMLIGTVGTHAALKALDFKENHVQSIKAEDILNNYNTVPAVKQTVLAVNAKGRTDIIGNLLEDLSREFKKQTAPYGQEVQDNYFQFIKDIKPEQAFAALRLAIENHEAWKTFSDRDDVEEFAKEASRIREERSKDEEAAPAKKTRKKKEEV